MASEVIPAINRDFYFQYGLVRENLNLLSPTDRVMAIQWMNTLKNVYTRPEDSKYRNDLLHFLLRDCRAGQLRIPFNKNPPKANLAIVWEMIAADPKNQYDLKTVGRRIVNRVGDRLTKKKQEQVEEREIEDQLEERGIYIYAAVLRKPKLNENDELP